jgi:hypothetical protein
MLFRFTRMVLDKNNQMLTFNFSLMNETLKQKSAVDRGLKNCAERREARKLLGYFVWKNTILRQKTQLSQYTWDKWYYKLHILDYLTTHTSLSPIRRGFALGFVNYKKGCIRLADAGDKAYQLVVLSGYSGFFHH